MRPGVVGLATPFADSGPGTLGDSEGTFITGRFDDSVIVGSEQGVVEEEDGFLGSGGND